MDGLLERCARSSLLAAAFAAGLCAAQPAAAAFPDRSITIVVPFPAGGSTDTAARIVAEALSARLRQPVVVENRGGAGGTIGSASAARAPADGYTLLVGSTSTLAIAPTLYPTPGYDPAASFEPIGLLASGPLVLVVPRSFPATSMADLVSRAKAAPGSINFGSAGVGTTSHLAAAMFASMAHVDVVHIPYRGGASVLNDLIARRLQFTFDTVQILSPHIASGELKALAVTSTKRHVSLPQVPTAAEAGLAGFEAELWFGLLAPHGTAPEILDRLNGETVSLLSTPELTEMLQSRGIDPLSSTRQEFASFIARERAKWGAAAVEAGARLE